MYSKRFSSKFFSRLLQPGKQSTERQTSSFTIVFEELDKMDKTDYTIVETGCV